MHGDGWWPMGWMGIWWILVVLLFVVGVWYALAATRQSSGGAGETPEDILKRRYATGEINREIYERMLSDLRK